MSKRTGFILMLVVMVAFLSSCINKDREAFIEAVQSGDHVTVNQLIKKGVETHFSMPDGSSPIFYAIKNGHVEVARVLLTREDIRNNGFFEAAFETENKEMIMLLSEIFPYEMGELLRKAFEDKDTERMTYLLSVGANPDTTIEDYHDRANKYIRVSLLAKAVSNNDLKMVKFLLSKKADPNYVIKFEVRIGYLDHTISYTTFLDAVSKGNVEIVKALIENGADPTLPDDKDGKGALDAAASSEMEYLVKRIFKKLPEIALAIIDGDRKKVELYARKGHSLTKPVYEKMDLLQVALVAGSAKGIHILKDMKVRFNRNNPKYFLSAYKANDPELVRLLVEMGFNPEAKLKERKMMPVFAYLVEDAIENTNYKMLKVIAPISEKWTNLMKLAADESDKLNAFLKKSTRTINQKNKAGKTALMIAAIFRKPENVKILLENGADVNIKDKSKNTAFSYAVESGILESVKTTLVKKPSLNSSERNCFFSLRLARAQVLTKEAFSGNSSPILQNVIDEGMTDNFGPDFEGIYSLLESIKDDTTYPGTTICP